MSQRTVTTPTAHETARRMNDLIETQLTNTVARLRDQGAVLNDQQNWDGGHAASFRTLWTDVDSALSLMLTQLKIMQEGIASVNQGIAAAGN